MPRGKVEQGKQKREEILVSIVGYIRRYGYPPTVREIGELVGLKSSSTVQTHLTKMLDEGIIETDAEGCSRAIRVPGYKFVKEV
ncbi:MAG: hypothetical protein K1W00_01935 [Lachnospiraceae bacterium]